MKTFFKKLKVLDAAYKYWLAKKPCVCLVTGRKFCNGSTGSPPHHLPTPDQKRRNRDDRQVPICLKLHRFYHDHPEEEAKDLEVLNRVAEENWEEYRALRTTDKKRG